MAFGLGGGGGRFGVVSKRAEDDNAPDVYQMIADLLNKARAGITAADLGEAAYNLATAADSAINASGGKIDIQTTENFINEVAAALDNTAAVSALFDDPLTYESTKMDAALTLLNGLMEKAQALEAEGKSTDAALAAISMTGSAMQSIVVDTVVIITYEVQKSEEEEKNQAKRWEFNGGYNYGPGGPSYSVGVSHSWGRRRELNENDKAKRWEFNAGVGHGPGGPSYSVGVSHSWRRRRELSENDKVKRWEFNAGVGHGPGGPTYSVGVSHSWRRRHATIKRGFSGSIGASVSYSWRRR